MGFGLFPFFLRGPPGRSPSLIHRPNDALYSNSAYGLHMFDSFSSVCLNVLVALSPGRTCFPVLSVRLFDPMLKPEGAVDSINPTRPVDHHKKCAGT